MLHGRRQFVPCKLFGKKFNQKPKSFGKGVLLSQETNETCAVSCHSLPRKRSTLAGSLALSQMKEQSTAGQYGSDFLGLHAAYNA